MIEVLSPAYLALKLYLRIKNWLPLFKNPKKAPKHKMQFKTTIQYNRLKCLICFRLTLALSRYKVPITPSCLSAIRSS